LFCDFAPVHYYGTVSYSGNHTQIMGYKNDTHLMLLLQILYQIQNCLLYRYIQRRGRFITN